MDPNFPAWQTDPEAYTRYYYYYKVHTRELVMYPVPQYIV